MKLKGLQLNGPQTWEKWTGYRGKVTFEGPQGVVQVNVGEALSQRILGVCAQELVAASRQVAENMTAEIIEQAAAPSAIESAE